MTDTRFGDTVVQVDRGGLTVKRHEFKVARIPTPLILATTNRFMWLESGELCVDVWALNKIGLMRSDFNNFHLDRIITLDMKQRGLYFDEGLAYHLWAPQYAVVLEIGQQFVTVEPYPLADSSTVDEPLAAIKSLPAGKD